MAKPILKWAGGKKQLLNELKSVAPKNFNNYYELFIGGGAFCFELLNHNTIINDINTELINLYKCISDNLEDLIQTCEELKIKYNKAPKEFYYLLRDDFELINDSNSNVFLAARTLLINKTCFNGLYRVNKNNKFNVPWNQKEYIKDLYDTDNLIEVSNFLKNTKICNKDYLSFANVIKEGDFVYLDPPYDKLNSSTFNSYNPSEFSQNNQIELKLFCDEINKKNAKFIVSNHETEFIKDLYRDYNIKIVRANRMINSNKNGRGKINEVIIYN